jgi:hypothetical protein
MTLDFEQVGAQVHLMGVHLRDSREERDLQRQRAFSLFKRLAPHWERLAEDARRQTVSSAAPLEPLDVRHPRPDCPADYEVLASDGSTIEPSRHGLAMYAVINVGRVRIRYGAEASAELSSRPTLFFKPEDLYVEQAGRRVLLQERLLDARRSVAEMAALAELAGDGDPDVPQVALADGLLTIWRQDWAAADAEQVQGQFATALNAIADRNLPLAAYVSNPHSHWVADLLRTASGCRADNHHCEAECGEIGCALDGMIDPELYNFLEPGERSARFEVVGRDADRYGPQHRSHFFYVNIGRELARIEIPAWVSNAPELVERIHAIVCDQADLGLGYPVALARAHEQAVISVADRRTFEQLLVGMFAAEGLPTGLSEKQTSKNLRAV